MQQCEHLGCRSRACVSLRALCALHFRLHQAGAGTLQFPDEHFWVLELLSLDFSSSRHYRRHISSSGR